MPTGYGLNAAKFLDPAVAPANRQPVAGGAYGGQLFHVSDEFTVVAGQPGSAAGDVLVMGQLNKGVVVVEAIMSWGVLGAGVTLALGVDGNTNAFVDPPAAAAAAGGARMTNFAEGHAYVADALRQVLITIAGGGPAAGQKIKTTLICMHQ